MLATHPTQKFSKVPPGFQSSPGIPKIRRVRKDYPGERFHKMRFRTADSLYGFEWTKGFFFFQFIWICVEGAFVTSCTLIFSRDILTTFFMGKQPLHFKNDKTRPCQLTDFSRVYPLIVVVF